MQRRYGLPSFYWGLVVGGLVVMGAGPNANEEYGTPKIARFSQGAQGAISLQFDDSMTSQIENAMPLLNARKLRATFFINPARPQHQKYLKEWEIEAPKAGHELANHTMRHEGVKSVADAEREIGECQSVLNRVYGPKPRIGTFGQPGGVPWEITDAQLAPIFRRHRLIPAVNRKFFDEAEVDPLTIAESAPKDGKWIQLGMHGTGGEWLSTSVPTITKLFDYLANHRNTIWVAPTNEVWKYIQERDAAGEPTLTGVTAKGFRIKVDCDAKKLETFDLPVSALYDQPLTIDVPVPSSWKSFTVRQGKNRATYQTISQDGRTLARFDVLPNMEAAIVERK